jgi:hypothetical protein
MDIFEEKTELQRTDEWFAARFGKFTASRFGDLMTKGRKRMKPLAAQPSVT